eukprot:GHVL01010037.1.p2 GENE.GHVL01010037.1~~GHVL01010037.1.p2  ORF type:complete len:144 (+),score=20.41 GHVL01010037.1:2251-2682(+)
MDGPGNVTGNDEAIAWFCRPDESTPRMSSKLQCPTSPNCCAETRITFWPPLRQTDPSSLTSQVGYSSICAVSSRDCSSFAEQSFNKQEAMSNIMESRVDIIVNNIDVVIEQLLSQMFQNQQSKLELRLKLQNQEYFGSYLAEL